MKLEIDVTRDDYWAFNRFFLEHRLAGKKRLKRPPLWLFAVVFGLLAVVGALLTRLTGGADWAGELARSTLGTVWLSVFGTVVVLLILATALNAAVLRAMRRTIQKMPKDDSGTIGRHVLHLTDEGVRDETAVGTTLTTWAGIHEVVDAPEHVFLFVDQMAAHIVPKRCLDAASLTALLELARARAAAAAAPRS